MLAHLKKEKYWSMSKLPGKENEKKGEKNAKEAGDIAGPLEERQQD